MDHSLSSMYMYYSTCYNIKIISFFILKDNKIFHVLYQVLHLSGLYEKIHWTSEHPVLTSKEHCDK